MDSDTLKSSAEAVLAHSAIRAAAICLALFAVACSKDGPTAGATEQPCTAAGQVFECTQGAACADGKRPRMTCAGPGQNGQCVCGTTPAPGSGMPTGGTSGDTVVPPSNGNTAGGAVSGTAGGGAMAGNGQPPSTGGRGGGTGGETPVTPPTTTSSGTWAMMGGDSLNSYYNPKETTLTVANAGTLKEKWRFMVAGYPPGTPVVGEGKVYAMATGGTYAIDLITGTQVWAKTELTGTASIAYRDGFIYVHTQAPPNLYKLKASDGSVVWGPVLTNPTEGCDGTSSPIIGGGKVVVGYSCGQHEIGATAGGQKGGLAGFDLETGTQAWAYTTTEGAEDGAMVWSSVAIDEEAGVVFAGTGNNYSVQGPNSDAIFAIDLAAGTKKWSKQVNTNDTWSLFVVPTGPDTDFGANPILAEVGGRKVVANGDKGSSFWMLDRETGEIIWSRSQLSPNRSQNNGGVLMNGAFDGKYFYVISNDPPSNAVLHKMDPANMGVDVWPAKTYAKITWGAPSLANGLLVFPNDDDLYVLNAETGDELVKFNTGGTIAAGAAAIVDGHIIVKSGLEYPLGTVLTNNLILCYGLP